MNIVATQALTKRYGAKAAVDRFDMQVKQGDIYGFVGRNGAGKSTVMKMISGLATPTSGNVEVFGHPAGHNPGQQKVGVLIESPGLYPHLSAYDNVMLKCLCVGVVEPKEAAQRLLALVGLAETGKKRTSDFSMGMKQRLGLALALVGDPDLLLLDEPLNGLDPEAAREIRNLIIKLNEERGLTVVISSHVLEQLGKMATRYGVIREGKMVCEMSAAEVDAECSDYLYVEAADPAKALVVLQEQLHGAEFRMMENGAMRIAGPVEPQVVGALLNGAGIAVQALYIHHRDLEEFFVEMMGGE